MKSKILFVLCLLVGLLFITMGLNKFIQFMPAPKDLPEKTVTIMTAFMTIGWLMPLVGTIEVIGGLLLIIPRTRALGVIVILPVLTGILLANISMNPAYLPIVFAIIAIVGWALYDNWKKYLPLLAK